MFVVYVYCLLLSRGICLQFVKKKLIQTIKLTTLKRFNRRRHKNIKYLHFFKKRMVLIKTQLNKIKEKDIQK